MAKKQATTDPAAIWIPQLGELYEMRPRPNIPPLRVPDPRIRGTYWPQDWSVRRYGAYEAGLFNDGDVQIRRVGESSGVMRNGPGGSIVGCIDMTTVNAPAGGGVSTNLSDANNGGAQ